MVLSDRLKVRFHIIVSENEILNFPESYRVRQIGPGSMLIECAQPLESSSRVQMELSLYEDETVMFEGMVSSCSAKGRDRQYQYIIGVEFFNLTDKNRQMLNAFKDYHAVRRDNSETANETSEKSRSGITEELKENVEYLYNWHKSLGYYKVLGIKEYAGKEVVRRAYYAMARKFHHDMHPGVPDDLKDKMNVIFTYINTAYITLSDPLKRADYDRTLIRKDKPVGV